MGKTFIAAVVMYNFWRWYPFGKIVFLAPTKPLVAQQIDACYEVMGIPSVDMIELTGFNILLSLYTLIAHIGALNNICCILYAFINTLFNL